MDGMIVSVESQSAEADSEQVAQLESVEESTNNVQSSENLVENVDSHTAPSESADRSVEQTGNHSEEAPGDLAAPDHVSSSTESYPGRNDLPSINHQSVLIPNMEPYLEEGSLDGVPKEFQDPTSSNSNPSLGGVSKTAIDSSNQLDTPCLNSHNLGDPPPESSTPPAEDNISHLHEPGASIIDEPVTLIPPPLIDINPPQLVEVSSSPLPPPPLIEINSLQLVEESSSPLSPMSAQEPSNSASQNEPNIVVVEASNDESGGTDQVCESSLMKGEPPVQDCESSLMEGEPSVQDCESSLMEGEPSVQEEVSNPIGNSSDMAPEEVAVSDGARQDDGINGVGSSTEVPPLEDQEQQPSESNVEEESAAISAEESHQREPASENCVIDSSSYAVASSEPDESSNVGAEEASMNLELSKEEIEEGYQDAAAASSSSSNNPPSDEQYEAEEHHYPAAESSDGLVIPMEPPTVCEADSSAAGVEEATYDPDEMGSSQQNVYVVEEGDINTVQQSGSLTPFHNSETAMLVEMAPLAAESYVNSQVQYVETGQEGMITDAQAAELLMRVSEQRPFQQDSGSAGGGGPYVQVQLAQTVEGITHLVQVPVSALANYCLEPSTLVYTTPGGSCASGTTEMATWQVMETDQQESTRMDGSKFSDIVSASIEAIGFPESVTPGANILSQAEEILINCETGQQHQQATSIVAPITNANFDFDDNSSSNSSLTILQDKNHTTATYPRPKRESIESRIHRLLRGANAPVPADTTGTEEHLSQQASLNRPSTSSPKTIKLTQLQTRSAIQIPAAAPPASTNFNFPKRPSRQVENSNVNTEGSVGSIRTVTIPAVFTAADKSAAAVKPSPLPPGCSDYFMPRGMSKRKAQGTIKPSKVNPSKPGCIDADPAPPEEAKVKLVMSNDATDDIDQLREDDEYNRAVLLQARQRKQQTEHVSVKLDNHHLSSFSKLNTTASPRTVLLSLPSTNNKEESETAAAASPVGGGVGPTPSKRVRLSFPPDIYANLEEEISSAYMAQLQTPKLTYTMPRTRQAKTKTRETACIDNLIKKEPTSEISVRLPWMVEEESEEELRRKNRGSTTTPRIIRQNSSKTDATSTTNSHATKIHVDDDDIGADEELVEDSGQVIVIGLDESGNQPSEEQLTAIIQAAMTKRESSGPERPKPVRSLQTSATNPRSCTPSKRKVADEENGVEVEENGVRMKVIRTYDRNVGVPRRKPPRSKKLSSFSIEIFDYEDDEEEEEDEEEVDDLTIFSKDLAEEEQAIREKEKKMVSQSKLDSSSPIRQRTCLARGRRGRGASRRSRGRPRRDKSDNKEEEEEEVDNLEFEDDSNDDDYKPTRGRGRGGRGSRSRGRGGKRGGGRRRVTFKEDVEEEEIEEEEEEEEERIPGMPSKPCPQCDERFTTREGFLDHIITHSSAKCLVCGWKNSAPKDKSRIRQHMSTSHAGLLPK